MVTKLILLNFSRDSSAASRFDAWPAGTGEDEDTLPEDEPGSGLIRTAFAIAALILTVVLIAAVRYAFWGVPGA